MRATLLSSSILRVGLFAIFLTIVGLLLSSSAAFSASESSLIRTFPAPAPVDGHGGNHEAAGTGSVFMIPGTVSTTPEMDDAIERALAENSPTSADVYAVTDIQPLGDNLFISVVGLRGITDFSRWNIEDNGVWFGLLLLVPAAQDQWLGAVQGSAKFSEFIWRIPDSILTPTSKQELDSREDSSSPQDAVSTYVFPWQAGTQMQFGSLGVHDNGFSTGWKAVDFLSDGDTGAGHAPNRLLAASGGSISYKCTPPSGQNTTAIRIGDLMYTHLLNSDNLYVGKVFSQGAEMGQMRSGSFNENCGYASQGSKWFHVHWGFPNTGSFAASGWTLNFSDQAWRRDSETRGKGDWFTAGSGASACSAPALIEPGDGAQLDNRTVTFRWNAVSGCTFSGYAFRVCTTSNMDDLGNCFIDTGVGGTERTETITGHDNQTLWWGVNAANAPDGANWATRWFVIDPVAQHGVQLCDGANYGASCQTFTYTSNTTCIYLDSLDDRAESLRFLGDCANNCNAVMYGDAVCSVYSARYSKDTPDFGSGLSNQFSSMRIEKPPAGGISLCRQIGYGDCVRFALDVPSLAEAGFGNDVAQSIGIEGDWSAVLYEEDNYHGRTAVFDGGDPDLDDNDVRRNEASSVRVRQRNPWYVTLYDQNDYSSTAFPSDREIYDLSEWGFDDVASSVQVAGGYCVKLFEDANFQGRSMEVCADRTEVGGLDNQVSSFQICSGHCPQRPGAEASLALSPASGLVQVNDIVTVDIMADTGAGLADTLDAYIAFDPAHLEVVDASGEPATAIELNAAVFVSATHNAVNNASGQIDFSASRIGNPYLSGSFKAATIRLRAKVIVPATDVIFVRSDTRWSDLLSAGEGLGATLTDSRIAVAASLSRIYLPLVLR